jgi:2-polyprenyl-6-methoxyphenol hydroxylase-like FAD-dependent oxidoreductase
MSTGLRVGIVGGGIGGTALAQGLRAADVDVRLYERDPSVDHRRQGYRIHISEVGEQALAEVLPPPVLRRVVETATHPGDLLAGFDSRLTPVFEQVFPVTDPQAVRAVDRFAFRAALMTGLDDVVRFGQELQSYAEVDGGVALHFADGRTEVVDVLVGADGTGSRVRGQLLPDLDVLDIGVRCLYGKVPLAGVVREQLPPSFLRGFCWVSGDHGLGAGIAPVLFREPPREYGDYLMVVLTGTNDALGRTDDDLFTRSPEDLWSIAVDHTGDWHPTLAELFAAADAGAAFAVTLRSCTRIEPWPAGRVTLLGDAVHPMTPAAGAGANTALRDAARLAHALASIPDVERTTAAVAGYEAEMIAYAGDVVARSLRNAEQMFGLPSSRKVAT